MLVPFFSTTMMAWLSCLLVISHPIDNPVLKAVETQFIFGQGNGTFKRQESLKVFYHVKNVSSQTIKGFVAGSISTLSKEVVHRFERYVEIPAGKSQMVSFFYQPKQPGLYRVFAHLRNSKGSISANSATMGYAIESIQSPLTRKSDFYSFWQKTKRELTQTPAQFKVIPKPSLSTDYYQVYLIEMKSLGNMLVKGWYRVPKGKKNLAAVLQVPSLGGAFYNVRSLAERPRHGVPYDFAVLSLNVRGHGNSKNPIDVGKDTHRIISYGATHKDSYIYRGMVMDCIRALDFLTTRSEIDPQKIAIEGGSQGGALSLIVAALDKRIKLCAPDVPFLSDMDNLMKQTSWVKKEFQRYQKNNPQISWWKIQENLSYFDTKNFADQIKVPVLMSIGLQDQTCPAITGIGVYNHIQSSKECLIYPNGRHNGGGEIHRKRKFAWMRKHWSM